MESHQFDGLVRRAFADSSRRGAIRVGIGALAASALAAMGLEAEAKKKKKKKKKKKTPVAVCPADLPITCGDGCCPSAYPLCCLANFGFGGGAFINSVPGESTCNPASFTCCPADQGGGSCGGERPKCCPATAQAPFGICARADDVCCTTEQGGFSCPADQPVCCLENPNDIFDGRNCCPAGSSCCQVAADCPGGVGPCVNGCCPAAAPREAGASRYSGRVRQGGAERLHIPAR